MNIVSEGDSTGDESLVEPLVKHTDDLKHPSMDRESSEADLNLGSVGEDAPIHWCTDTSCQLCEELWASLESRKFSGYLFTYRVNNLSFYA